VVHSAKAGIVVQTTKPALAECTTKTV
jgi:hypothetical protein